MQNKIESNLSLKTVLAAGLLTVSSLTVSTTALASGFEKAITWGGEQAGVAGIGAPSTQGADALYFNPAGLVSDKTGQNMSFNLTTISAEFKGPINNNNDISTSDSKLIFPFGLMYGNTLNEKVGFGVGAFVSGGSQVVFSGVDFSAATGYKPEAKTDLAIVEISAGAGYKVSDSLKLGAAWRVVMAQADLSFVKRAGAPTATSFVNAKLTGLKDTQPLAFRLGAQYKVDDSTEIGLNWRTEVNFEAKGKVSAQLVSPGSASGAANPSYAEADATAKTTFPMAVSLGAKHKLNDEWNILGQYDWTQYSRVGDIPVTSSSSLSALQATNLKTDWRDQHNVRLAGEYLGSDWPVRFGYCFTSAVTNPDYAKATFTPPGPAHTFTVGSGHAFKWGEQDLHFNGGFDYTTLSGEVGYKAAAGTGTAAADGSTDVRNGTYSTTAYALHLSLAYMF